MEKPSEGAAQFVTGSIDARPEAQAPQLLEPPTPAIAAARLIDPKTHLEELVAKAALRIESGDIVGARELLAGAELGAYGPGLFALAETYDPNKLASLGTRDVVADAVKARGLYRKALNLGVARAQERLDARLCADRAGLHVRVRVLRHPECPHRRLRRGAEQAGHVGLPRPRRHQRGVRLRDSVNSARLA